MCDIYYSTAVVADSRPYDKVKVAAFFSSGARFPLICTQGIVVAFADPLTRMLVVRALTPLCTYGLVS